MKTILKFHANGNLESVATPLIQSGDIYLFTETLITVPKIIEYPPQGTRNYFIEKTSVPGFVMGYGEGGIGPGDLHPQNENDRTSDFIDVSTWGSATTRVRFKSMNGAYRAWVSIIFYDHSKKFLSWAFDNYVGPSNSVGDYTFTFKVPVNAAFLRVSTNYYDNPNTSVKISVENGDTSNTKHYLASEDLPEWVRDTGNPISFFPQGIVIKGDIIQSNA